MAHEGFEPNMGQNLCPAMIQNPECPLILWGRQQEYSNSEGPFTDNSNQNSKGSSMVPCNVSLLSRIFEGHWLVQNGPLLVTNGVITRLIAARGPSCTVVIEPLHCVGLLLPKTNIEPENQPFIIYLKGNRIFHTSKFHVSLFWVCLYFVYLKIKVSTSISLSQMVGLFCLTSFF